MPCSATCQMLSRSPVRSSSLRPDFTSSGASRCGASRKRRRRCIRELGRIFGESCYFLLTLRHFVLILFSSCRLRVKVEKGHMVFAFDTLSYSRFLRERGVSQEHAKAHAEAARQFIM